jgi:hypothetical protein
MSPSAMLPALRRALDAEGLLLLSGFDLEPDEPRLADLRPRPAALLLVGNRGSTMWHAARPRRAQSLDAWTERTVGRIAAEFGLSALYPFSDARWGDGPWPFTRRAMRTGRMFASPLGLTIHPTYGLWHAFRAALLLPEPLNGALGPDGDGSPCERCAEDPVWTPVRSARSARRATTFRPASIIWRDRRTLAALGAASPARPARSARLGVTSPTMLPSTWRR